jgi:hypothetical protein
LEPFPCLTARFYGYYDSFCGTLCCCLIRQWQIINGRICLLGGRSTRVCFDWHTGFNWCRGFNLKSYCNQKSAEKDILCTVPLCNWIPLKTQFLWKLNWTNLEWIELDMIMTIFILLVYSALNNRYSLFVLHSLLFSLVMQFSLTVAFVCSACVFLYFDFQVPPLSLASLGSPPSSTYIMGSLILGWEGSPCLLVADASQMFGRSTVSLMDANTSNHIPPASLIC